MPSPRYVTLTDAATYLGVSVETVRGWVRRRQIPHSRPFGRRIMFDLRKLDRWIEAHEVEVRG